MKSLQITNVFARFDGEGVYRYNRLDCKMHETFDIEEYNKHPDEIFFGGITYHKFARNYAFVLYQGKAA